MRLIGAESEECPGHFIHRSNLFARRDVAW